MPATVIIDYYAVLGVARDASIKDINSAYKKLALKHHPDKAGTEDSSLTTFRKIQEAIEVLRDPVKRKKHDRDLHQKNKHWNLVLQDDPDFGGPGYTGWTPYGGKTWDLNNGYDRYMSSFRNAYHMEPDAVPRDAWAEAAEMEAKLNREEEERRKAEEEAVRREAELELEKQKRRRDGMKARLFRDDIEMAIEDVKAALEQDVQKHMEAENVNQDSLTYTDTDGDGSADFSDEYSEVEYSGSYDSRDDDDDERDQSTSDQESHHICNIQDAENFAPSYYSTVSSMKKAETEAETENDVSYDMTRLTAYFNFKLSHPSYHYTLKDLKSELEGIVLETFCGFLEDLRLSFPHAKPMILGNDPEHCPHYGTWTKKFLRGECEVCHRFQPLYILICPGCGKKACVGCKFEKDRC